VKILYLESTKLKAGQTHPTHKIFSDGNKISVKRYSNGTLLHGKIEAIGDSSIIIKGKTIFLKDIKSIHANRKPTIFIVGGIIPIATIAILYPLYKFQENQNINNPDYFPGGLLDLTIGSIAVGVVTEVVGIIDLVIVKHYHLDKDFIITVKTLKIK
jgi:hypothetical protein